MDSRRSSAGFPSLAHRARAVGSRVPLAMMAAAVLAIAASFLQGCAADNPGDQESTGQLVVALSQPGPHGEIFHLDNATFDITLFPEGTTTTVVGGTDAQLTTGPLRPGLVLIQLRDGWTLEKSTDGGATFQPVPALLGSLNPSVVRVLANQPAFVEFTFLVREPNGTLQISLGVVTEPRELAGAFIVQTATGDLANYAVGLNSRMDFAVFFQLTSLESVALDDGTKQRVYTAFSQGGSFGPIPQAPGAVAAEFYNDRIGTLSGPIATELTGGFLTYTVAAKPDGTVELSGSLSGGATDIEFGPDAIDAVIPTIGPDGFPDDVFFYDSEVPFTQSSFQGTLTGILRVRHIPPPP